MLIGLQDFTATHSECRLCVRAADDFAREFGDYHEGLVVGSPAVAPPGFHIRVREQNRYYFRRVYPVAKTLDSLYAAILGAFEGHLPMWTRSRSLVGELKIHSVHRAYTTTAQAWSDARLVSDAAVVALEMGSPLEVVFV